MSAGDLECRTLQGEWIRTTPSGMIADFTGSGDSSYDTAEECFAACREEGETLRNGLDDGTSPEKSFACHAVSDTTNAKPIACLCALALLLDSSLGVFGTGGATIVCGLFSYQCPIVAPMRSAALTSVPRQLHEQRVLQFTLTFHEWLQTYQLRMWCIFSEAKSSLASAAFHTFRLVLLCRRSVGFVSSDTREPVCSFSVTPSDEEVAVVLICGCE